MKVRTAAEMKTLSNLVEHFTALAFDLLDSRAPETHRISFKDGTIVYITIITEAPDQEAYTP